jgi:hypothetical protein
MCLILLLSVRLSSVLSKKPPDTKGVLESVGRVVSSGLVAHIFNTPSSSVSNISETPGRLLL